MGIPSNISKRIDNKKGTVLIFVTIAIAVLIMFAAFAIDLAYLFVIRNELKNAADAGSLAGAQVLYVNNGTQVNEGANGEAARIARLNSSQKEPVDVHWVAGQNIGSDIERGHWRFSDGQFFPSDNTNPPNLWDMTTAELDADLTFINAVRVKTRREDTPAAAFFSRIFGYDQYFLSQESVAYIGFAGTLGPGEADQPIAICKQAITNPEGEYTCGVGRMINSGSNEGHQTGGWTNFTQPCETASANSVRPLVCGSGNPGPIQYGDGMGTTGGEVQTAFDRLIDCWKTGINYDSNGDGIPDLPLDTDGDGWPDQPWELKLPVINCDSNNVGPCSELRGAVVLQVVWVTRTDKNQMNEVPRKMGNWTCPTGFTAAQCWNGFVTYFNLRDVLNNSSAFYEDKTIYFLPDCSPHIPSGNTGGENYGVLARIPVLVK